MKQIAILTATIGFRNIPGTETYSIPFDESDDLTIEQVRDLAQDQKNVVIQALRGDLNGYLNLGETIIRVNDIRTFNVEVLEL